MWVVYERFNDSTWWCRPYPYLNARAAFRDAVKNLIIRHKATNKLTMEDVIRHYKRGNVEMWIADFGKLFPSGEYLILLSREHVKKAIEVGLLPPLDVLTPKNQWWGARWDITDNDTIKENIQYRKTNTTMKQTIKIKESELRELVKRTILRETSDRNLAHMAVPGETDAELEKNWLGRTTAGMSMDDYGNNGDISGFMEPNAKKLKSKKAQSDASWDAYDDVAGIADLHRDNYEDFYDLDKNVNYDNDMSHARDYVNHDAYFVGDDPDPIAEAVRKSIKKVLKEKQCLTEDICIGKGGGYYGGSPIFRVCVENGNGTDYLFSPPGWDFDTKSQLEAAAICCSSNKSFLSELLNSPELNQLPVAMPSDNDKIEALYWLTGGNVEWNHGYWAEHGCKWNDETIKLLMGDADIIGMLDNAVSSSKSFAELVSHLREGEYMVYANDILPLQYDDEEGYDEEGAQEPLQESKLRAIIKESIQKVLNESDRHEIFTLDIFDIENENGIDDMQYACDYESVDEAIQAAREVAQKYADMDTVINVFVMAGEYMDAQGNVLGEPDAIYCVSNKDRETTMQARTNAGYSNPEANEYVGEGQTMG